MFPYSHLIIALLEHLKWSTPKMEIPINPNEDDSNKHGVTDPLTRCLHIAGEVKWGISRYFGLLSAHSILINGHTK
jgi:hypothetical protein